jgi:hypothetical protein
MVGLGMRSLGAIRWQLPQRRMPFSVFQLHAPQFEHRAGMWTTVEAIFLVSVSISLFGRASATVRRVSTTLRHMISEFTEV